jgi:hypothetical protein
MLQGDDGTKKLSPELQPPKVAPAQAAWANRAVMATQRQQRLDIKSAEGMLAAASKKMQALQAAQAQPGAQAGAARKPPAR